MRTIRAFVPTASDAAFQTAQHDNKLRTHSTAAKGGRIVLVAATSLGTRLIVAAVPGVVLLPDPLHPKPITGAHAKPFAHLGVKEGDSAHDLWSRLHAEHGALCDPEL